MSETIVFVDIDATLVDTRPMPLLSMLPPEDRELVWFRFRRYATMARPSARPFLIELAKQFRVQSLTLGITSFQNKVLKALDLIEFFEEVHGRDCFQGVVRPARWVLVDDVPPDSRLAEIKLSWMGLSRNEMDRQEWKEQISMHYIQCEPFDGEESNSSLLDLIDIVIERLNAQSRDAQGSE